MIKEIPLQGYVYFSILNYFIKGFSCPQKLSKTLR